MIFHGFNKEVFTGVVILDQSFFFDCLRTCTHNKDHLHICTGHIELWEKNM